MRIAVIQNKNSRYISLIDAMKRAGMEPVVLSMGVSTLTDFAGFVLVGDLLSNDDMDATAFIAMLRAESAQGKPILGIAQGAKIVVDAGLVPGLVNDRVGMAVKIHAEAGQLGGVTSIRLTKDYQYNAFTRSLQLHKKLSVFVSSAEFVIPPGLLMEMQMQGLCLFQYENKAIAAVANKAGNVMALLSHFENAASAEAIFLSMHDHIVKGHIEKVAPLHYQPR